MTRARTLLALGVVAGLIAFPLTGLAAEWWPGWLAAPWPASALLVLLGAGVLSQAWPVRQYVRGRRPQVDGLRSAGVLALAKSCSLVGAGLIGVYLALVGRIVVEWVSPVLRQQIWQAGLAVVASACLCAVGQIAQTWCRLPPDEPDAPPDVE
ncbi:MAG: DUF3180 domain-containing protein [Bifidobacteriaceae bacterium]|nr:DUF3180 domain-containing protein [Bifidobacteriaceae bacterium]